MKVTNVKDFKNRVTTYLKAEEPTLVVRHGKVAGLLFPLRDKENLPTELGDYIKKSLDEKNISEEEIINDFRNYKK